MPIHRQLWSAEETEILKCLKTNDEAPTVTIITSQPSSLEGSRDSETAEMLLNGIGLVETNKKIISLRVKHSRMDEK